MLSRNAVRKNPAALPVDGRLRIAIVGRGPAGIATAIALLRRLRRPFHLWMIDAADFPGSFGNGVAGQATMSERAGHLSVLADRPSDFVDWLESAAGPSSVTALRGFEHVYVPRSVFRDYLTMRFGEIFADRRDTTVQTVSAAVTALETLPGDGLALTLDDGSRMIFDEVLLATGHGRAGGEAASWLAAEQLLWNRGGRAAGLPFLLSGDGPRMAALLLHLRASGYAGRIRILAGRGRLPQAHAQLPQDPEIPAVSAGTGLAETLRELRDDCRRSGQGWQAVIDGLNGQWPAFWRALPPEAQRRYWRHLRNLHRLSSERIAPELHRQLMRELQNPATELVDARILGLAKDGVRLRRRGSREDETMSGRLVDCREEVANPADGLLAGRQPGTMRVEDDGRLMRFGAAVPGLNVIGRAAGGLRADGRLFADTVRQIYRAAISLDARYGGLSCRAGG